MQFMVFVALLLSSFFYILLLRLQSSGVVNVRPGLYEVTARDCDGRVAGRRFHVRIGAGEAVSLAFNWPTE